MRAKRRSAANDSAGRSGRTLVVLITGSLPVTSSIGVTTSPDGSGAPSAVLAKADRNLYAAKHAGRDQVVTDLAAEDVRTARPVLWGAPPMARPAR